MLWVSGLFWFLQRSRITKVTFTGMAWGNAHRREICICAIGGDKLGGMPDTGRIHIFIALTFLLHNLCVTIEGCRQMGSSFVKGEYFRYYSWDFISSFFFCTAACARLSRVIARWGSHFVGRFVSLPSVFGSSPIWTGLCALPRRDSLILDSGTSAPSGDKQLTWNLMHACWDDLRARTSGRCATFRRTSNHKGRVECSNYGGRSISMIARESPWSAESRNVGMFWIMD